MNMLANATALFVSMAEPYIQVVFFKRTGMEWVVLAIVLVVLGWEVC